jgi:lipid A 3-O-deacylase
MRTFLLSVLFASAFIFSGSNLVYAQNYKNQFTLITDNDMYINPNHDRYYSDGTYFNFTHAISDAGDNDNLVKKTIEFEFGQKIYTGLSGHIYSPYHIDRPFTGYLFANSSLNWLYKDEDALKFTAEIGTIGPAALGEEVQSGFHQLFGLYKVVVANNEYHKIGGWSHQLNTEPGLNLRLDYKHLLYRNDGSWFDVAVNPDAWLGSTFTGASAGVQLRVGDLNKFYQSVITNTRVSSNSTEQINHEFYFFTLPQINYVVYDATIEGGLFRNDKGPVTFGIYHFVYQQQFGLQFASARWSASTIAFIKSREVKSTALGDQWGSINIAYRFGKI